MKLIELGTGFDGELTGRENIFFNGALLGHSRADLLRRMDEIVDFADIGEFIDAPLRTYSTGMVSRLAFAIATTVDPEILLLDEILSVGDAAFKEKSRERIRERVRQALRLRPVVLHAVAFGSRPPDRQFLEELAESTGGRCVER